MSDKITKQEAEQAAQTLRDYAYQEDAAEFTQTRLLHVVGYLGLDTRAPVDI